MDSAPRRPRLLLLMPSASYRVQDFLEAARREGADVRVGSDRCHVLAEHFGVPLALDFRDPEAAAAEVVAHARSEPFDAVIATDDKSTAIASLAAAALGLRHNPPAAAYAARNKAVMRERLAAGGVPAPPFRVIDAAAGDDAAVVAAGDAVGFPCVVKPLLMSASRGVLRADSPADLIRAAARVCAILRAPDVPPSDDPAAGQLLIERFVPGREVALEAILVEGRLRPLALFDKPDPLDGPCFEETLYVTPSRLPPVDQERIVEVAGRAALALGLTTGPVHAELRLGPEGGVQVIEVAGRSIGGLCSRTLRFGAGVSLEELIVADALGRPLPSLEREARAAGVMMIPIPRKGILREVRGVEQAAAVPGIESVEVTARIDHEIVPLPEGSAYLGFLFARGESPAEVEAALRRAHAALAFVIVPNLAVGKGRG